MVQINSSELSAHITVNHNRLKTYGDKVYLKNDACFEIELWNPKTTRVLVYISIDRKLISKNGIILNPGQRVYLERWIDESKKFLFSTYNVENTKEAKNAISNNGLIEINFYDEQVIALHQGSTSNWYASDNCHYTNSSTPIGQNFYTTCVAGSNASVIYSDNSNSLKSFLETGITEKGASSDQKLYESNGNFNYWITKTVCWQLLPESSRPVEADKIRSYCTECGTRVRASSWKFCPSCGSKV